MKRSTAKMQGRSRWWRVMAILAVFGLIAAACSGESGSGSDSETATDETDADSSDDSGDDGSDGSSDDDSGDDGSDDSGDDSTDGDDGSDDSGDDSTDGDGDDSTDGDGDDAGGGEIYVDPRGGIFADFQTGFDRSHPFQSLDSFCVAHDEAVDRVDTDPGITADVIQVGHIRQQLEDLIDIGFGVEVGDTHDMFERYVSVINDECGGIRGRQLDLAEHSYSPLEGDAGTARACLEATEDRDTAFAVNSSGLQGAAVPCLTEEGQIPFVAPTAQPQEFMDRSGGRLISLDPTQETQLVQVATFAAEEGLLEGKTIAVVGSDQSGQPEAVEAGLVNTLTDLGFEPVLYQTIQCEGGTVCNIGTPDFVSAALDAGVDVIFPTLNILSLPALLEEMNTQGFVAGEVQFITSNFASAAGDLVASKSKANTSAEAAALYNGAISFDSSFTGNHWAVADWQEPRFNEMCGDTYTNAGGVDYDWSDPSENTITGMLTTVCSATRIMARALYDAGDNPTDADIVEAIANLGPVDVNDMGVANINGDKRDARDNFQSGAFATECPEPEQSYDDFNTCWVPNNDWRLVR